MKFDRGNAISRSGGAVRRCTATAASGSARQRGKCRHAAPEGYTELPLGRIKVRRELAASQPVENEEHAHYDGHVNADRRT